MANILASNMRAVTNNLLVLSASPGIQALNLTEVQPLLAKAQSTTGNITTGYGLSDASGRLVGSSNGTSLEIAIKEGQNNSQQPWFLGAKELGATFIDPEYFSILLNKTVIVFAQPVYAYQNASGAGEKNFVGIIAVGVSLGNLGALVKSQLAPQTQGTLGVVNYNGTVLYGSSTQSIGKNLYDPTIEAQLPPSIRGEFYGFVNDSLSGSPALRNFVYDGVTSALASEPILYRDVIANESNQGVFAVVYVTVPSTLAASQVAEINQLRFLTFSAILGVIVAALVTSLVIVRRNRSLSEIVKERTKDLERSLNTSLLLQDILTHDIRNYNQITRANAELLQNSVSDEKSKRFVDSIEKAVDGSTDLIQKARMLADMTSGESVVLTAVSLRESLERSLSLVKSAFPEKRVEVSIGDIDHPEVIADSLLDQVFVNIFSNAVKNTDGSEVPIGVEVEAKEESDKSLVRRFWKVSISDHGRGIPDESKPGVFTRYLGTTKGRGLGLSIVRALVVDRYSGKIELRNRVEGDYTKGTVVEIWLPRK